MGGGWRKKKKRNQEEKAPELSKEMADFRSVLQNFFLRGPSGGRMEEKGIGLAENKS